MKKIVLLLAVLVCLSAQAQQYFPFSRMHPESPRVPEYVVFAGDTVYLNTPDRYERMDRELIAFTYSHTLSTLILKRSKRIFGIVEPIMKANGLHEDLKYLMVIESNLDPKAVSTAKAAGLWQFMEATARGYGLEITPEVDERFNMYKETVAACKMLKSAYRKYGNWMTAAASYNFGGGNVDKRIQSQHQENAMDLLLPTETSRYMFRLLAAKMFFEDPLAFGYDIHENEMYPLLEVRATITVNSTVEDLVEFAEKHGTTFYRLKEANPWLRDTKLTVKPGKSYEIIIPD
ncbi:MAG: lytic transglycosylase domain-containing protein [Bacteroidales bacterium]|nr:lytic transglycosylase domain-containing protein [Bacteroidales bacterium]